MANRALEVEFGKTENVRFDTAVDSRVGDMRRLLEKLSGQSTAEAMRVLRDAFPDAPLDERVRAMKSSRH